MSNPFFAAQGAVLSKMQTMADGSLRVVIDLPEGVDVQVIYSMVSKTTVNLVVCLPADLTEDPTNHSLNRAIDVAVKMSRNLTIDDDFDNH